MNEAMKALDEFARSMGELTDEQTQLLEQASRRVKDRPPTTILSNAQQLQRIADTLKEGLAVYKSIVAYLRRGVVQLEEINNKIVGVTLVIDALVPEVGDSSGVPFPMGTKQAYPPCPKCKHTEKVKYVFEGTDFCTYYCDAEGCKAEFMGLKPGGEK